MLQKKLHNLKLNAGEKVSDYVAEARNLVAQLENAGDRRVSDDMLQTIIIEGLSIKYSGFLFGWNSKPKADKNLVNLEAELIAAEEIIMAQDDEVVALAASIESVQRNRIHKKSSDKTMESKFKSQCFYCKETGHRKFECTKFKADKEKEGKKKLSPGKNIETKKSEKEEETAADAVFFAYAFVVEENLSGVEQVWLADSGASYHMVNDKSVFENLQRADMTFIKLGDKSRVSITGKDDVKIEADEWHLEAMSFGECSLCSGSAYKSLLILSVH